MPVRRRVLLALAFTIASCGGHSSTATSEDAGATDGGPPTVEAGPLPPDYVSGTRLRAEYWVTDDGMRVFNTWYDTKLMTPCAFEGPMLDDTWTCVPQPSEVRFPGDSASVDASCQSPQRFVWFNPAVPPGPSWASSRDGFCGTTKYARQDGVYLLGAELGLTTSYDKAGGCSPHSLPAGVETYAIERQLNRTEFVAAHVELVDTGRRLKNRTLVADDGTRQRVGWYDTVFQAPCDVSAREEGKACCFPTGSDLDSLEVFADSACTQLQRVGGNDQTKTGEIVSILGPSSAPTSCGKQRSYHRVGAPATGDLYIKGEKDQCTKLGPIPGMFLLTEIPASSPDAFHDVTVGSGRLQAKGVGSDAEGAVDWNSLTMTDTLLKEDCTFGPATDGTLRCFPSSTSVNYSDMSCKTPAVTCPFPPTSTPEASYAGIWIGHPCTGGLEFHELGELRAAQGIFQFNGGVCVGSSVITPCYSIGPVVPSSSFAEGKLVVDGAPP